MSQSSELRAAIIDLVIANRVLARMGAVDAYGHVSLRHPEKPDRFLIARSRSPELVEPEDIMEVDLQGRVCDGDARPAYLERFIHAAVFARRPDVNCVVHGHARVLLPFTVTQLRMRPIFMTADEIGADVPVWEMRDRFGESNLLVMNMEQGDDLAAALGGEARVVLMRAHGFVGAARSAEQIIRLCRALLDNAELQLACRDLGPMRELSRDEIEARRRVMSDDASPALLRGYECEALQAGCADLFAARQELHANGV